ncbi:hypothetical protein [Streptomyces sp. NPDC007020]|uniref:hypothetical protein n=1 Tax=Streptomyces sp. NPDC007020 TaxID=3154585 RepID=UPI0033C3483E
MTSPAPDAQVRLDTHPTHASAVIAIVTGPDTAEIVAVLEADAWHTVAEATLVLVRIDREEPHWAQKTADRLTADGVTVAIPRYVFRGPVMGPLASGPGMTVSPCRTDDLGGGVTGSGRCRRRR